MATEVRRNDEASRYELLADGVVVGVADYRLQDDTAVFVHTEIEPPLRGRGLGETLVEQALDDVRRAGRRVRASCWFVAEFIDRHEEYEDLVA